MMREEIDLIIDYPANIAKKLLNSEIDIGLVPVAILKEMKEYHILTDYCIGSEGEVASVCIFSEVPIDQIKLVLLDYQSRTSVALAKVLMKEYWKIDPEVKEASTEFREEIKGTTAAVVIGDRAFEQRLLSKYQYDLGEAWMNYTGLPFVFAAWVSNKPLSSNFIDNFNKANAYGFDHITEVLLRNPCTVFSLKEYYNKYISFDLTDKKRKGLNLFLDKLDSFS